MKKNCTIVVAVLIFLFNISVQAQNLKELAVLNLDNNFFSNNSFESIIFKTAKKKQIGKFECIELWKIIEPHIKHTNSLQRKQLLIMAESNDGDVLISSFFDYAPSVTKLPPYLVFDKVNKRFGDTVTIAEKGGKLDLSEIDAQWDAVAKKTVFLQIKSISKNEQEKFFKNSALIFPVDAATDRWISDVKSVKIFLVQ